jgi:hypothetical protein
LKRLLIKTAPVIVLTIAGAVAYFLSGAPTQDVPSGLSTIPKEAVKEKPSKSAQSALTYHADGTITLDVRKARLELDARLIEHIPQSQIIAEVERLKAKYKGVERSKQLYVYFKKIIGATGMRGGIISMCRDAVGASKLVEGPTEGHFTA